MSISEVQADYTHQAPCYDQRWADYVRDSVALTLAHCSVSNGQALLDVGCGTGTLLHTLHQHVPNAELVGVDVTAAMLVIARQKLPQHVRLQEARAESLPFASNSFDWVVSSSVFHYFSDPLTALVEWQRILKPGGRLVLTDWNRAALPMAVLDRWLHVSDPAHSYTHTMSEAQTLITAADFRIETAQQAALSWFWHMFSIRARKPETAVKDQRATFS